MLARAVRVQTQGMVGNVESLVLGHRLLALFDLRVVKLFHPAAVQAHQMVMVLTFVEFVNRFAAFKMAASQNVSLLKLSQHAVHRGQTHIGAFLQQHSEHVLGGHVPLVTFLEDLQDFQPRQGCLEAGTFEFINLGHAGFPVAGLEAVAPFCRGNGYQYNAKIISLPACSMFDSIVRCVWLSMLGATLAALSACGTVDSASNRLASIVTPYKIDIVQGNFVSREQAEALKPGMSRGQVKNILGTPLLASVFHADRWDYVFTFKRQGVEPQARRVTVFFKDEVLARVEADELPTEAEFVASLDSGRKAGVVPVLEMSEEALKATAKPPQAVENKPAPSVPASYPPLEAATR